ncbi:hypothetical protein TNCV_1874501 [Trichonephila clavipes]|nr:hypothetical protein TNCV_1874501 [Trichonephila clavipes]
MPSQVSSSSLYRGSKERGPWPIAVVLLCMTTWSWSRTHGYRVTGSSPDVRHVDVQMHVKSVEAQSPHVGLVLKSGDSDVVLVT